MLDLMRKKKETVVIKAIFILIVLSFIGTIFLVWGKGEEGLGRSSGYAAKVDRTVIGYDSYQNSYQRLREIYQQILGPGFTHETEKELGLPQQAIDRLIDNVLIAKAAKGMGVNVSKDDVASAIAAMPAFQHDGKFDYGLYQQTLRASRITANDFEESQKHDLLISKTRAAVMNKVTVSDAELLKQFHQEKDKVELVYTSFAAADLAADVTVTDEELEQFLQKKPAPFKTAEKIALTWFLLPHTGNIDAIKLENDEAESFYRRNLDRYLGDDNNVLPLEQIKNRVETDAKKSKAAKLLYEKAADTLFQNIKAGDIELIASKLGAHTTKTTLFAAAAPPAELAAETELLQKAFELPKDDFGGPLETAKGFYIFKVTDKKGSEVPPLAQVRSQVEQQLRQQKAAELARGKAIETQKLLSDDDKSVKTATTAPFSYNELGVVPGIGNSKPLLDKAFELTEAAPAPSEPFLLNSRWYAFRLHKRTVAPEADFNASKSEIKERLLPAMQEKALLAWLKELRGKSKVQINPAILNN